MAVWLKVILRKDRFGNTCAFVLCFFLGSGASGSVRLRFELPLLRAPAMAGVSEEQVRALITTALTEYDQRFGTAMRQADAAVDKIRAQSNGIREALGTMASQLRDHREKFEEVNTKVPGLVAEVREEIAAMKGIQDSLQSSHQEACA